MSSQSDIFNRRQFLEWSALAATLSLTDVYSLAHAFSSESTDSIKPNLKHRLSYLANRTTSRVGVWELKNIEGEIPPKLNGALYRIGPGQKENHGVQLKHFFDGDALVSVFNFKNGRASLKSKFIDTPQRIAEARNQQMLYHEFGTRAPTDAYGFKFQPNINLIDWGGQLLAFSESDHPAALDKKTLAYKSKWDFYGTLPSDVTFTAHPKIDPKTGHGYAFGFHRGLDLALKVYRMNVHTGLLNPLYSLPQESITLLHDFLMTENYLIFLIPPCSFSLFNMMMGVAPFSKALNFDKTRQTQVLVLRKDGLGYPLHYELPASMFFHHGNAYEENGKIYFETFAANDASMLDMLGGYRKRWSKSEVLLPELRQYEIYLPKDNVVSSRIQQVGSHAAAVDFPAVNLKKLGQKQRYLYAAHIGINDDPLAFNEIIKFDTELKTKISFKAPTGHVCGEPIFISDESNQVNDKFNENGWCVFLGYDSHKDETYVQICDAKNMKFVARVFIGAHLPLGFHGAFYAES
jgi:all-trans-8'-apo-beta-carotenal 15,15'-oxygenase